MKNARERITISIRKEILNKIDKKIDGLKLRNRSHAIETMVVENLGIDVISDVIIMAGGENATKSIEGIKELLVKLKNIGVEEVIVAVGYLGKRIKGELKSGEDFGLHINYLEKGEGTGGVLLEIKKGLKKSFLVINIDKKIDLDLKTLIDFHKSSLALATVATENIKTLDGVYVLEPETLDYLPKGFSMIEEDVFPKLLEEGKLTIYPIL